MTLNAGCISDASDRELCRNATDERADRISDWLDGVGARVDVVRIANL